MPKVQGDLVFGFDFDFRLHKLTFSYGRSRAQLAPTGEAYSQIESECVQLNTPAKGFQLLMLRCVLILGGFVSARFVVAGSGQ